MYFRHDRGTAETLWDTGEPKRLQAWLSIFFLFLVLESNLLVKLCASRMRAKREEGTNSLLARCVITVVTQQMQSSSLTPFLAPDRHLNIARTPKILSLVT